MTSKKKETGTAEQKGYRPIAQGHEDNTTAGVHIVRSAGKEPSAVTRALRTAREAARERMPRYACSTRGENASATRVPLEENVRRSKPQTLRNADARAEGVKRRCAREPITSSVHHIDVGPKPASYSIIMHRRHRSIAQGRNESEEADL